MKGIRHTENDQHSKCGRSKDDLQGPSSWRPVLRKRRPVFRDPPFLSGVTVQVRLDPEVQIAPVLPIERNEPKRLMSARQGAKHLRPPEHRSPFTEEHQTDKDVRIQWPRQEEHAASRGNDLQITSHAASILASENGRGGGWKAHSCRASGRKDLGEAFHARQVCDAIRNNGEITEVPDRPQSTSNKSLLSRKGRVRC